LASVVAHNASEPYGSAATVSVSRSAQFMAVNVDRAVSPCPASGNMAVWLSSEKRSGIAHEH
jgi:hypothetical protein